LLALLGQQPSILVAPQRRQKWALDGDYSCSIEWRNGTSFGLNDLEALLTVAREAKEWIAAHALKR